MASLELAFDILARDKASKEFNKVGDAADNAGKKGKNFGPAIAAGVAVAAAAAVGFAKQSVQAFVDSEQASLRLDEALAKFPNTADRTRASFDDLNAALAKKTRFDDDATASGQAVLAQFELTGEQIQDLTPLLQDYAAKTGKDLPDAALDLGKAIQGQGRALKAVGLDLKDTGSKTGNLDDLTKGLRKQVGGFATAEGKTAAGQAAILGNQFGELQEQVGQKLTPVLSKLASGLLDVIDFIERNKKVIVPLVSVLGGLAAVVVTVTQVAKAYTAVQAALNIVLAANPIGLIILAIAALVAGLVLAYKNSETFRDTVNGAFTSVQQAAGNVIGFILKLFGGLLEGFLGVAEGILAGAELAFGWVPGVGDKLKGAKVAFESFKDDAVGSLDKLAESAFGIGEKSGTNTAKGLNNKQETVRNAAAGAVAAGKRGLEGLEAEGLGAGEKGGTGTATGINNKHKAIANAAAGAVAAGKKQLEGLEPTGFQVGKDAGQGLVDGLNSKFIAVASAAQRLAIEAGKAMRSGLQERSPSKVTREIGAFAGIGLKLGLEDTTRMVQRAAMGLATATTSGLSGINGAAVGGLAAGAPGATYNVTINKDASADNGESVMAGLRKAELLYA